MNLAQTRDRYLTDVALENYLKGIYQLGGHSGVRVKTKALADRLDVSLPSVTGMLRSLAEMSLVDYTPYQGVDLTAEGRRIALRVIRHHRLVESFLVAALGFRWDEVHEEAEILEHAISTKLAAAMERYLGYPKVDPHGDPIPSASGEINTSRGEELSRAPPGTECIIARIHDQSPDFLRYLEDLGILPGARVEILQISPFDGPILIRCEAREISLSRSQLSKIEIK